MAKITNADGLVVKLGLAEGHEGLTGVANDTEKCVKAVLDHSDIVIGGGRIQSENPVVIPANSYITRAVFVVTEGFDSGTTATLDLGLSIADGTYTGGDEDGIDAAIAESAIDTAGKVVVCNGASVGGTVTTGAVDLYLSYDADTAVYTVGRGILYVWYVPASDAA